MMIVLIPTRIASCIVLILQSVERPSGWGEAHQCVIAILSGPLSITLAPPGPAIFASRDCAHVTVMVGREDDGSDRGGR